MTNRILFCFVFLRQSLTMELWLSLIYVDQVGFKLRDPPASAYQVLRLKVCATLYHSGELAAAACPLKSTC